MELLFKGSVFVAKYGWITIPLFSYLVLPICVRIRCGELWVWWKGLRVFTMSFSPWAMSISDGYYHEWRELPSFRVVRFRKGK